MTKNPIDLTESAAGEEDPGADIELAGKAPRREAQSVPAAKETGKTAEDCDTCEKTGKVDVSIGPS